MTTHDRRLLVGILGLLFVLGALALAKHHALLGGAALGLAAPLMLAFAWGLRQRHDAPLPVVVAALGVWGLLVQAGFDESASPTLVVVTLLFTGWSGWLANRDVWPWTALIPLAAGTHLLGDWARLGDLHIAQLGLCGLVLWGTSLMTTRGLWRRGCCWLSFVTVVLSQLAVMVGAAQCLARVGWPRTGLLLGPMLTIAAGMVLERFDRRQMAVDVLTGGGLCVASMVSAFVVAERVRSFHSPLVILSLFALVTLVLSRGWSRPRLRVASLAISVTQMLLVLLMCPVFTPYVPRDVHVWSGPVLGVGLVAGLSSWLVDGRSRVALRVVAGIDILAAVGMEVLLLDGFGPSATGVGFAVAAALWCARTAPTRFVAKLASVGCLLKLGLYDWSTLGSTTRVALVFASGLGLLFFSLFARTEGDGEGPGSGRRSGDPRSPVDGAV